MTFGRQVDHPVEKVRFKQLLNERGINNVALNKLVIGLVFNILQVGQITGISKLVEVNNVVLRILSNEQTYNVRANKPCTSGNENVFHFFSVFICDQLYCVFMLGLF